MKVSNFINSYFVLEKIGNQGELKILPRVFHNHDEVVNYLKKVEESAAKSGLTQKKSISYFLVRADQIEFL